MKEIKENGRNKYVKWREDEKHKKEQKNNLICDADNKVII